MKRKGFLALSLPLVFALAGLLAAAAAPQVFTQEQAVLRIVSPTAGSDFARPLAAGDLDGDGYDDLVIGQSSSSGFARAYVIRGGQRAWNPSAAQTIHLAAQPADKVIEGASLTVNLPSSIAIGDLNGDGISDLALAASSASPPGRAGAGIIYVALGSAAFFDDPTTLTLTAPGSAAVLTIYGPVAYGDAGAASVFGGMDAHGLAIGDLNGDGIGDLAVGSHLSSPSSRSQAGQVNVLFGRTSFSSSQVVDLATASNVRFDGARNYYETGTHLAIGDVTGDGIGDLVIGCPVAGEQTFYLSTEGIIYLFRGRGSWAASYDLRTVTPDLKILGRRDGDELGSSLVLADMNRDGTLDLCLGADGAGSAPSLTDDFGAFQVFFGGAALGTLPRTINLASASPSLEFTGPEAYSYMGNEGAAGVFDGSGFPALACPAVFAGPETNGWIEVLRSRDAWAASALVKASLDQHDFRLAGPAEGRYGYAIAAGDMNGDGVDEIMVGAPFLGDGEVHVFQLEIPLGVPSVLWGLY